MVRFVPSELNAEKEKLRDWFNSDGTNLTMSAPGEFWGGFIDALLDFFHTGVSSVPIGQTLEIISLVEAGVKALERKGEWIKI